MHLYQAGTFTVTLTAYDNLGNFKKVSQNITIQNSAQPCDRGYWDAESKQWVGLTIKGKGDGAVFPQSQINSQTHVDVNFQLPTGVDYNSWVWSTGNVHKSWTIVQSSGATLGPHEMFFRYKVGNTNYCHVIGYTVVPGSGIADNDTENRSSSSLDKLDVNVFPNPTNGPVELDLSGQPAGVYMINVIDQTGRQVTKKIVKQD